MKLDRESRSISLAAIALFAIYIYKRLDTISSLISKYQLTLDVLSLIVIIFSLIMFFNNRRKIYSPISLQNKLIVESKGRRYLILPVELRVEDQNSQLDLDKMKDILEDMGVGMSLLITKWSSRKFFNQRIGGGTSTKLLLWSPLGNPSEVENSLKATLSALNSSIDGIRLRVDESFSLHPEVLSELLNLGLNRESEELKGLIFGREEKNEIPALQIGEYRERSVGIPLADMSRHVLIVGQTGSGKTTTSKRILYEAWNLGIPSLVLDIHWEYKSLIFQLGGRIFTAKEGLPSICINPLAWMHGGNENDEKEIFLLAETLSSILDLTPSQFYLLMKGLKRVRDQSLGESAPSMRDLLSELRSMSLASQAEEESRASLIRKLDPILTSEGSEIFNCGDLSIEKLGNSLSLIDIGDVRSDILKQLIVFFILRRVKDRFVREEGKTLYPRILIIIEEAEKLIPHYNDITGMDIVDRLFSELRKFGVSLILIAQSLADIPEGVVRNTGTKIFHRVESPSDLRALRSIIGEKKLLNTVTSLSQGECLMITPNSVYRAMVSPVEERSIDTKAMERILRYTPFYWPS